MNSLSENSKLHHEYTAVLETLAKVNCNKSPSLTDTRERKIIRDAKCSPSIRSKSQEKSQGIKIKPGKQRHIYAVLCSIVIVIFLLTLDVCLRVISFFLDAVAKFLERRLKTHMNDQTLAIHYKNLRAIVNEIATKMKEGKSAVIFELLILLPAIICVKSMEFVVKILLTEIKN